MTTFGWSDVTFEGWLAALHARTATAAARSVLTVLMQQPERASHASTSVIAESAGVNIASVTRAAQSLGFEGWPNLRDELRSRYLNSLNRPEVAESRRASATSGPFEQSFEMDLRTASRTVDRIERATMEAAVAAFAGARTRLAIGGGSYGHIAQLLASIATLGGYETHAPAEGSPLVNAIARLDADDIVVAFGFRRHYDGTIVALEGAESRGATVVVVTDQNPSPLTELADHVLPVSAEGSSFFPSLTAAVATINAFCAELASLDAQRTSDSLRLSEVEWSRAGLLRRPARS
jgi:DNA-binding MurR/RpiR family transcriptional regulator